MPVLDGSYFCSKMETKIPNIYEQKKRAKQHCCKIRYFPCLLNYDREREEERESFV